ncbi:MAG TPA: PIN domain-containing protein [Tepidisphaeraceae bacterium]|nr:PIN domain-containing protein [Tepidisphaeraceae bacterium]
MILHVLRALFILLMAAVGWFYLQAPGQMWGDYTWLAMLASLATAILFIALDIASPRRKLAIFSGSFLGLIVGILIAYGLSFAVRLIVEQWQPTAAMSKEQVQAFLNRRELIEGYINMIIGVTSCYLSISFILQTKDDFRFIIPYVEFAKERKGSRPALLDTSALIDGRIAEIAATGIMDYPLIVPRFVLVELQTVADSSDKLRRNRGRRGLDVLAKLQHNKKLEVVLYDSSARGGEMSGVGENEDVDQKLMALAKDLNARVLTTDYNLHKVAQLRGVDVISINDVATAVKPVALPGERMMVRIIKSGESPGQGVGFLDDGTMVVVESARAHMNEEIEFVVTNALQTNTGKMIFGRMVPKT